MIRSLCAAMFALMLMTGAASATERWYYDHNGSVVALTWDDEESFTVTYVMPKPGLPAYVHPGTVLLEGSAPANGSLYAIAHVFSAKCGTGDYQVSGTFLGESNDFTLKGPAPVLNEATCTEVLSWSSPNSHLYFTFLHY